MVKTETAMIHGILVTTIDGIIATMPNRLEGLTEGKTIDAKEAFGDLINLFSNPLAIKAVRNLDPTHRHWLDNIFFQKLDRAGNTTVFDGVVRYVPGTTDQRMGLHSGLLSLYVDKAGEEKIQNEILVPLYHYGNREVKREVMDALMRAFEAKVNNYGDPFGPHGIDKR